ncbi:unnamed protein product [Strongylus vulgaris]|uniref:DUF4794 domain-containing protein n=1 Tax=Strongylus vulgaris TaxID=40348 RepID=A0A3P7KD62_STRVU|nr:unnamed protein product [Strongylus vulgaris]
MNALHVSALAFALLAAVSAKSIVARSAGSNAYGDEPAVVTPPPSYEGEVPEETTIIPTEEEPQAVENENPAPEAAVVESGYRSKRQAGDNSYGDEPVPVTPAAYEAAEVTTLEPAPEEEPASVPVEPVASEPIVEESGYRA